MNYQNKKNKYEKLLNEYLDESKIIFNKNKSKILELQEDEVFQACWDDSIYRRTLPDYWFISNKQNLISMYTGKPVWVKQNKRKDGTICYKYYINDGEKRKLKSIEVHNLIALVFNSETYGRAGHLLNTEGVYAFGIKKQGELKVNGHHKNGNHDDNNPNNIQIITTPVHIKLDNIPNPNLKDEDKENEFMGELANLIVEEEPDKITLIQTGYSYDKVNDVYNMDSNISINTIDKLLFSKEALKQINIIDSLLK